MAILERWRAFFHPLRSLSKRSVDVRYALIEACIIGLFSAVAALFLKAGIGWLGGWRIQSSMLLGGATLPLMGLVVGLLAGWLIEQFAPEAAGGGIPQVKAVLARFPIALSLRVAVVKAIATSLVLGAGMTLGRRGPTVHIGAALAAQLSQWVPTSPEHRRQMIAAGAAAGLAAGFNTPIAGVLFVVEELMRDISGLTLETAILASFVGAALSRALSGSDDLGLSAEMLSHTARLFNAKEIPFYLLLGAAAGILGAVFNRGVLAALAFNRRLKLRLPWRIALAGAISGAVIALLPPVFRDNAGLREFLMMSDGHWTITAIAFVTHFALTIVAYGAGAPGGLFAPALVLGSALGFLVGISQEYFLGLGSANTYALAGMGAFFTAVVRVPVTSIVIVFEMTADFNLVLPLMVVCAIAYVVGESVFAGSLYTHLLVPSGIQLSDDHQPEQNLLTRLRAADVMRSPVESLEADMTVEEVLQAIARSHHRGFPVLERGWLVGIVTQGDFEKLTTGRPGQRYLREIMTPRPIVVKPSVSLSHVLYLLNRYQISRLPVVEGHKLVGMITRSDIIRAEAEQLGGQPPVQAIPSYVVYQTRSPAIGRGRLLLPLANPDTALELLRVASAIALHEQYELECLQVITIPKHLSPSETPVDLAPVRKLMQTVEAVGAEWHISVHTQIRVGHDVAETILEAIGDRHINLLLMGWKRDATTPDVIFGGVVDVLIRRAPCELVLIKPAQEKPVYPGLGKTRDANWLIPTAGGPNAEKALELLPALARLYPQEEAPTIWLCHVYPPESDPAAEALDKTARSLQEKLGLTVLALSVRSYSVADAIARLAADRHSDLVMLGVSREGLLQQVVKGNIPEAIARRVDSTVILVRGPLAPPPP